MYGWGSWESLTFFKRPKCDFLNISHDRIITVIVQFMAIHPEVIFFRILKGIHCLKRMRQKMDYGSHRLIKTDLKAHLMLIRTSPFLKMKSSILSCVTSWKFAFFSFAKKRSGFHKHWNILGSTVSASLL